MSAGISQQFCVRWNSHLGSLGAAFPQLLAGQRFVDVTLACEGHQVHCHRLVLAACSTYFESLLGENPCKHPIIILPRDIKLWEIQALVDFMYKGEVNVSQAGLPDLLKCAETLQIRGLCGSDAALNLNHITTGHTTTTTSTATTTTSSTSSATTASLSSITHTSHNITATNVSTNHLVTSTPTVATSTTPNSTSTPIVTRGTGASLGGGGNKIVIGAAASGLDVSSSTQITNILRTELLNPPTIKLTTTAAVITPAASIDDGEDSANGSCSELNIKSEDLDYSDIKMRDDYNYDMEGSGKLQAEKDQQPDHHHHHHPPQNQQQIVTISPHISGGSGGGSTIRVKSNENLFENYKHHHPSHKTNVNDSEVNTDIVPSRSSTKPPTSPPPCYVIDDDDDQTNSNYQLLPPSLKFNKNTMAIYIKSVAPPSNTNPIIQNDHATNNDDPNRLSNDNFESIICSPNFTQIPYMDDDDDDDDDNNHKEIIDSGYMIGDDDDDLKMDERYNDDGSLPHLIPFGLLQNQIQNENSNELNIIAGGETLSIMRTVNASDGSHMQRKLDSKDGLLLNGGRPPPPSAVVLRNPRGNQPRTYNTDALYAALMDVKSGESIYRASQIHKVPRKTLRNWMKRWDIKSAYPMPRQLKQAAENKKKNKIINQAINQSINIKLCVDDDQTYKNQTF